MTVRLIVGWATHHHTCADVSVTMLAESISAPAPDVVGMVTTAGMALSATSMSGLIH